MRTPRFSSALAFLAISGSTAAVSAQQPAPPPPQPGPTMLAPAQPGPPPAAPGAPTGAPAPGAAPAPGTAPAPAPAPAPGGAPAGGWGFAAGGDTSGNTWGGTSGGGEPAPAPNADQDWERRTAAMHEMSTISGSTGLLRVANAISAPAGTFRVGVLWDYWSGSSFLCNDATPCLGHTGDKVSHFGTTFTASATVTKFLEAYGAIRSYANSNDQGKPELLQVLGDTTLGLKAFVPTEPGRWWNLGFDAQLLLLNGTGGVGLEGSSTSARGRAIFTGDFRQPNGGGAPILAHLNAGYRMDNSGKIVEGTEQARGNQPITRIERYGLGINRVDFGEIGIGLEGVFSPGEVVKWVRPFAEYTVDIPINRQQYTCNPSKIWSGDKCLGNESSFKATPSRVSLGLRAQAFLKGLMFTGAVDIGVSGTSDFLEEVAPQAPWTLWWGVGYAFDTEERPPVVRTEKVERVVQSAPPVEYDVRGFVHEQGTTSGIAGAKVTFQGRDAGGMVTDATGHFSTVELQPGSYTFQVSADGYKDATCTATVSPGGAPPTSAPTGAPPGATMGGAPDMTQPGGMGAVPPPPAPTSTQQVGNNNTTTEVDCPMEAMPKMGVVSGSVQSDGGGVGGAKVTLTDAQGKTRTATTDPSGAFKFADVTPGTVKVRVESDQYMGGSAQADVKARETANVTVSINKRPKNPNVIVGKNEIIIKQQVHFETGSAKIMSDSDILLQEIADVLTRTPRIKQVEIQGHTDNTGSNAANRLLSQQRAEAVRDRLVQLGVPGNRLVAKGYGADRPLVPNVTAGNRARNRRVALVITEQDKQ